jgi:hypothetical protein
MASNNSFLAFHRPIADLTELRSKDPTLNRGLPHTKGPIADDSYFETLRSVDDLIIRLDDLGAPGPLTVHVSPQKCLGEGGQFIVHEGSLLEYSRTDS